MWLCASTSPSVQMGIDLPRVLMIKWDDVSEKDLLVLKLYKYSMLFLPCRVLEVLFLPGWCRGRRPGGHWHVGARFGFFSILAKSHNYKLPFCALGFDYIVGKILCQVYVMFLAASSVTQKALESLLIFFPKAGIMTEITKSRIVFFCFPFKRLLH